MKKILLATDFSENATRAFFLAQKMAREHEAQLLILHVFDIPTSWNYPHAEDAREMERQAKRASVDRLKERYDQLTQDVKVTFIAIGHTSTAGGILATLREYRPEMLVLGTRGKSHVKEVTVGSTSKALIRRSPIPVLVVPDSDGDHNFRQVLYASDLHEQDAQALPQLVSLLKPFEPEITVIHISTPDEYKGDEQMKWFKEMVEVKEGVTFQLLLAENVYEGMSTYIRENNFNLLVMLEKERHGFLDTLYHHDLVTKFEFHTSLPLLSFNEHSLRVQQRKVMSREAND